MKIGIAIKSAPPFFLKINGTLSTFNIDLNYQGNPYGIYPLNFPKPLRHSATLLVPYYETRFKIYNQEYIFCFFIYPILAIS